ncbi:unnamed protein product [Amoebophrya sp. A120]|nr:unnamed protein product [Amoebophrya sp. A120]|eukprot:GSA120T00009591001.1
MGTKSTFMLMGTKLKNCDEARRCDHARNANALTLAFVYV